MFYPYDSFVRYLFVVKNKKPAEVQDIITRMRFVPPDIHDLYKIRKNIAYKIPNVKARDKFRRGKKLTPSWYKKLSVSDAKPQLILDIRDRIINIKEIRRTIECLIIRGDRSVSIQRDIYEKYRDNIPMELITLYKKYFWNPKYKWEQWLQYISKMDDVVEKAARIIALKKTTMIVRDELALSTKLDPLWGASQIANRNFFWYLRLVEQGDPRALEIGDITFNQLYKLAKLSMEAKADKSKAEFLKKLEMETRKFGIPAIDEIKARAEDIPYTSIVDEPKEIQGTEILEFPPVEKPKNLVRDDELVDEPGPEPFGDEYEEEEGIEL